MNADPVMFAECDRVTVARIAAEGGVLVLPIGAIEQHGPHLPVWTDTLVVETVCRAAAESLRDRVPLLLAPTMPFGSSAHHLPFGGTLSLDTGVLLDVLMCLGRSAQQCGFGKLFVVNGHGGNHEIAELAARDLSLRFDMHVAAASWWRLAWSELAGTDVFGHGRVPGHAGAFETAVVASLRPDLLRAMPTPHPGPYPSDPSTAAPPARVELAGFWQSIDGYTDQPGALPAATGARIVEIASGAVARAIEDFHHATSAHA